PCRERGHRGRKPELVEREDLERDGPERAGHRSALHEDVGAEPRQVLDAEGEVELLALLELDLLLFREDGVAELLRLHRRERRQLEGDDRPVYPEQRWRPGRDVHVARALFDHGAEQLMKIYLEALLFHVARFAGAVQSAMVTRMISAVVVTPSITFRIP